MTVFDRIEKLKRDYTDKYVVVDRSRPELMRFRERTGQVKTVNMSGRALVEFAGHNDIGWYDIEIDFLKVVDKPVPGDEASKPTKKTIKKPAAEKEPSSLEKARAEKTGDKPKMSTADILAAARAKKEGGEPGASKTTAASTIKKEPTKKKSPAKKTGKMSTADILAAARSGKSGSGKSGSGKSGGAPAAKTAPAEMAQNESSEQPKPAAKTDRSKMSTADILAAARAAKAPADEAQEAEATIEEEKEATIEPSTAASAPAGELPTDTAGIIAYCRQNVGS